ncbi:DNA-processing protein DprA [Devriesea agamarum]|uniref:DNA-processing protein DprA n=1 Tax=Devriesea agamarum TaxID=472569 RepID=UPI00071CB2AD|nr:DNA-processing protein DprA [Devriesea agamarum]
MTTTTDQTDLRHAAVSWSLIAEPHDALAHLVCSRVGPVGALTILRTGTPTQLHDAICDAMTSDSLSSPSSPASKARLLTAWKRWSQRDRTTNLDAAFAEHTRLGGRVLVPGDEEWPHEAFSVLAESAPHCLWVRGRGHLRRSVGTSLAMVGARASSPYGEDVASSFAAALVRRGVCIISGGAYGIDGAAHRSALAAERAASSRDAALDRAASICGPAGGDGYQVGDNSQVRDSQLGDGNQSAMGAAYGSYLATQSGSTVAVLAGGLDRLYPRGHHELLHRIIDTSVIISEAPPGTTPTRWRFLARNRLISALGCGTVVVEAGMRSGALATARRALDQGRPVGVVPGPITSASSAGCHDLVRTYPNVLLVTSAEECLAMLPGGMGWGVPQGTCEDGKSGGTDGLSGVDRQVLDALPPCGYLSRQGLVRETGFTTGEVDASLARLELLGYVRSTPSGAWVRARRG